MPRASWGPGMYAELIGEGPIVVGSSVYAPGYHKSLALLLACTADASRPVSHVFFIDDAPNNAYEVQRDLPGWLSRCVEAERAGGGSGVDAQGNAQQQRQPPVVRALWWDLYEEEFRAQTVAPTTCGPDFAYLRSGGAQPDFVYGRALRHFGLSRAQMCERAERYERVQRERDQGQAAKAALERTQPSTATATQEVSVRDRRNQLHQLLVATGRTPGV